MDSFPGKLSAKPDIIFINPQKTSITQINRYNPYFYEQDYFMNEYSLIIHICYIKLFHNVNITLNMLTNKLNQK